MQEQDYIMRLIKEMVRTILKLIFNIDMDSPEEELLAGTQYEEVSQELLRMVNCGNISRKTEYLNCVKIITGTSFKQHYCFIPI